MGLNYLYYRHGVSLIMAKAATSSCARMAHEDMAEAYSKRIAEACPADERQFFWTRWEAYMTFPCVNPVPVGADLVTELGIGNTHAH